MDLVKTFQFSFLAILIGILVEYLVTGTFILEDLTLLF